MGGRAGSAQRGEPRRHPERQLDRHADVELRVRPAAHQVLLRPARVLLKRLKVLPEPFEVYPKRLRVLLKGLGVRPEPFEVHPIVFPPLRKQVKA